MTEPNVYRIPAVNFPALEEAIVKMNRRARRLGCNEIVLKVVRDVVEKREDKVFGFEYDFVIHECTVEGEIPKLKGWKFIATIEPVKDTGENMIREMPGEKCPTEYRTSDMHCDQCHITNNRKSVYVLRHDVEGYKQVGRNCLADFLGDASPDAMLAGAELMMDVHGLFSDASGDDWGYGGGFSAISIHHFVSVVAIVMKKLGWVPKAQADEGKPPTAQIAFDICSCPHAESIRKLVKKYDLVVTDEEVKLAQDAVKWASEIDPNTASNTYLYDLGVCCRSKFVTLRTIGFVASCVSAYQRHMAFELSKKMNVKKGKYLGTIGKREVFNDLTVIGIHPANFGRFVSTWIRFADKEGNVLSWKASGNPDWPKLEMVVTVTATVEKHTEFNGTLQTVIARVRPDAVPA